MRKYLSNFNSLPQKWINLFLIVLAGFGEGIGLALFIPIIELMMGTESNTPRSIEIMTQIFSSFGIGIRPNLTAMLVIMVLIIAGSLFLILVQRYILIKAKHRFLADIRHKLIGNTFYANWGYISNQSSGEQLVRLLIESVSCSEALGFQVLTIAAAIQALILFLISSAISWQLSVIMACFVILTAAVIYPFQRRARLLGERSLEANRNYSFHAADFLRSAKLIKVTSTENKIIQNYMKLSEAQCDAAINKQINSALLMFVVQALPVAALAIIVLFSANLLSLSPAITIVFIALMSRIAPRLAQVHQHHEGYNSCIPSLYSVSETIDKAESACEQPNKREKKIQNFETAIQIKDVSLRLSEAQIPVLSDINVNIPKNSTIAFVGRSGSGKSTLADIICGLRTPDSGGVFIDNTNLDDIDLNSWRQLIGYVTQDIFVFNDSLRNNLLFANPEATEHDIQNALEIAHLKEFIDSLPNKLDTCLGEGGTRLSGGQRQRLALARALISKPKILLLDEATSALDSESENFIHQALENIAHTLTIIIIAHRLSTVRQSDYIYVIDEGHVLEEGVYEELLLKSGHLSNLHNLQIA